LAPTDVSAKIYVQQMAASSSSFGTSNFTIKNSFWINFLSVALKSERTRRKKLPEKESRKSQSSDPWHHHIKLLLVTRQKKCFIEQMLRLRATMAWLWLPMMDCASRGRFASSELAFFGHDMCNFTSEWGEMAMKTAEHHGEVRFELRPQRTKVLFLNIEKVLRNVSNNKRQHSTFFTIRKKAKQQTRRVNEQKSRTGLSLGTRWEMFESKPRPWRWEPETRSAGERRKKPRSVRFWVSWLHQVQDNLWVSDRHRPPNFLSEPLFGLLINIIGSVSCETSYDRRIMHWASASKTLFSQDERAAKTFPKNFHRNINKRSRWEA
jgi:hypothetical protein